MHGMGGMGAKDAEKGPCRTEMRAFCGKLSSCELGIISSYYMSLKADTLLSAIRPLIH